MPRVIARIAAATLLLALWVSAPSANRDRSAPATDGNDEALFDATTTREELMDRARGALNMGQNSLAEVYYQEILLRDPEDVDAMCDLALLYRRTGRLEYARGLLLRAGSLMPGRDDIPEERREIEKLLRVSLTHQADSLMAASQYDAALPRLSLLLTLDPDNARHYAAKARCLAALGQSDAALSNMDLALAKDPRQDYQALRSEIAAQHEKRRIDELESSAKRLLESNEWMRDEAAEVLQAILAQDPSNQWARDKFREISGGPPPTPEPVTPPASTQLFDAASDVIPAAARWFQRNLAAIVGVILLVILFRSPLARALAKRVHEASPLAGDLSTVDVSEALRLVNTSALTGVLTFRTPAGNARVYFERGAPVHCSGFGRDGLEALVYLVKTIEQGTFHMKMCPVRERQSIDQPLDLILAESPTSQAQHGAAAKRNQERRETGRKKSRMAELLDSNTKEF